MFIHLDAPVSYIREQIKKRNDVSTPQPLSGFLGMQNPGFRDA